MERGGGDCGGGGGGGGGGDGNGEVGGTDEKLADCQSAAERDKRV